MVGGVRFYERKEVKDALAYLKLLINPHDDVSFRRVVNVPTRGIGKVVMDALEQAEPDRRGRCAAAHGRRPVTRRPRAVALGQARHVLDNKGVTPRAHARAQGVRRDHRAARSSASKATPSRRRWQVMEKSGYFEDLREEKSRKRAERLENLAELVSAAREYELREPDASLGGFVDRLSLLSEADEEHRRAERPGLADDHARRQGPRVPGGDHARDGGRPVPAQPRQRGRSRPRGRAAPLLRRHHPRREAAVPVSASRRRVFGEYQPTEPSRFLDEIPKELVEEVEAPSAAYASRRQPFFEMRVNPYGRRPASNSDWDERPTRGGIAARPGGGARSGTAGYKSEPRQHARGSHLQPGGRGPVRPGVRRLQGRPAGPASAVRRRHDHRRRGRGRGHQADRPVRQRRPEEADGPVREPRRRPVTYRPASRRSSVGAIAADQIA